MGSWRSNRHIKKDSSTIAEETILFWCTNTSQITYFEIAALEPPATKNCGEGVLFLFSDYKPPVYLTGTLRHDRGGRKRVAVLHSIILKVANSAFVQATETSKCLNGTHTAC